MYPATSFPLARILCTKPQAFAQVRGSRRHPQITGLVKFYQTRHGVVVCAELHGLPAGELACGESIFGFHIHEGGACSGDSEDAFSGVRAHYNPSGYEHPYHAGDLPPLFAQNGFAVQVVLSGRFCVQEIIGKTVVVAAQPDDFSSHSSGHAGEKVACGVIRRL